MTRLRKYGFLGFSKRFFGKCLRICRYLPLILNELDNQNLEHRHKIQRIGADHIISLSARFTYGENITLGGGSRISEHSYLMAGKHGKIIIGANVLMGPGVLIVASNQGIDKGRPMKQQDIQYGKIIIGDDVWIGINSVILPGVRIGSNMVVGADSILSKDIPDSPIVVGNPRQLAGKKLPILGGYIH